MPKNTVMSNGFIGLLQLDEMPDVATCDRFIHALTDSWISSHRSTQAPLARLDDTFLRATVERKPADPCLWPRALERSGVSLQNELNPCRS